MQCKTRTKSSRGTDRTYLLMSADPKLGIRHIRIDLVDDAGLQGETCNSAVEATDAPCIILHGGAEGNDCVASGRRVGADGGHAFSDW